MEREHERDEFQQEIRRLEAQLRQTAGVDNKGHRVRPIHLIASVYRVTANNIVFLNRTMSHRMLLFIDKDSKSALHLQCVCVCF